MLTSEYFAMDGALVLAVPTKLGQEFSFVEIEDEASFIYWKAYHQGVLWLDVVINYKEWRLVSTSIPKSGDFIMKVLRNLQYLSSTKFKSAHSYQLSTNLQFPANYGLGSSSTLMVNLAEWGDCDPYELNAMSLGGSGYDIAVAKEKSAVLFRNKPEIKVQNVTFDPAFKDELIFIHLNEKQDSREGIKLYRSKEKSQNLIDFFDDLTMQVYSSSSIENFSELMVIHEEKISKFIGIPTVKEKLFAECPVFVKSLGAWGGDFVMSRKFDDYQNWFSDRGFSTIYKWSEIIN